MNYTIFISHLEIITYKQNLNKRLPYDIILLFFNSEIN